MAGNGKVLKWSLLKSPGGVLQATVNSVSVPLKSIADSRTYMRKFSEDLKVMGSFDRIDLLIDSVGGSVASAFGMQAAVMTANKPVRVLIQGSCCSAATIVAFGTAPKTVCITHSGRIMFHMPRVEGYKNKGGVWSLIYSFTRLETVKSMVTLYRTQSKRFSRAELKQMMSEGRVLNPQEAVETGFADKIVTLDAFQRGAV